MVSALLLLAAARQPATVTLSQPAAHSSVVLAAFGKAIGETVRPTGSVLRDYFLLRFDKMPVEDAKSAIAKALNATWQESGGVLYLTRTKQQELAEEQELADAFQKAIDEAVADERKKEGERKPYDRRALVDLFRTMPRTDYYEFEPPEAPIERLHSRLVASLDPKELAKLPYGKTSYSTRPEGDSRPLPKAWRDAYTKFLSEAAVWRDAIDAVFDEEDERRYWMSDFGGRLDEVATFELQIKERDIGIDISFNWEEGGQSVGYGGIAYSGDYGTGLDELLKGVTAKVKVDDETRKVWRKPDGDGEVVFDDWGMTYAAKIEDNDIAGPLKTLLADAEKNEPLSVLVSWPFFQLAEARGENMVVLVPDDLAEWPFSAAIGDETTLEELFQNWWFSLNAKRDQETKCWYLTPADRSHVRETRVDRAAFARLLRSVAKRGWMSFAEVADYYTATGSVEICPGFAELVALAANETPGGYSQTYGISMAAQIYAAIPAAQRAAAWRDGLVLPVEMWPAKLRQLIANAEWGEQTIEPDVDQTDPDVDVSAAYRNAPELTKVFRGPLPRGTTLRLVAKSDPALWFMSGEGKAEADFESIGWHIVYAEKDPENYKPITKFAPAPRESMEVEIHIPGVGRYMTMDYYRYTPFDREYKSLDKLDAETRKQIEEAVKKAREGDGLRLRLR